MSIKILTYRETLMDQFVQPVDLDPTTADTLNYVGRNGAVVMFSFDSEKIQPQENLPEHEQRVWDLDDPVQLAEMKEFVAGVNEIKQKIAQIQSGINKFNTFVLFKGIIDKDKDVIAAVRAIDTATDDWLKSIGLPGVSIL
jgi:hypothetical protein